MIEQTFAVSTRIRLARNLSGVPFPCMIEDTDDETKVKDVCISALRRIGGFNVRLMSRESQLEKRSQVERYVISRALSEKSGGAVAYSDDGEISVMINEEDHVREQIIVRGNRLDRAYKRIAALDNVLKVNLNFACAGGGLYYTACPSNLGTGMRASVMLFLPALVRYGEIERFSVMAGERGLVIRGAFGEGSDGESFFYQVSNEVTYRITEREIVSLVSRFVDEIRKREEALRRLMYNENAIEFADKCVRALATLSNCVLLSYSELSELITYVKLGADAGVINSEGVAELDDLLVMSRSATLKLNYGSESEELIRAKFVRESLAKLALSANYDKILP